MGKVQSSRDIRGLLPVVAGLLAVLTGCANVPPVDQVDLMPAPDVYGDGLINPLPSQNPAERIPYSGILFATDRTPAGPDAAEKYYLNDRGRILRVGVANVTLGKTEFDWEVARQLSMMTNRDEQYPVKISGVDEWGILQKSVPYWVDLELDSDRSAPPDATDRFARAINAQMDQSGRKDVYLFVHGYKVVYENPVLVSAELWHFLGYQGAFIAYAWPSTPNSLAYVKDSDTSGGYARNFRLLLEFLADSTEVENIHVIGYSNGTRLVARALEQLALKNGGVPPEALAEKLRIRNVILVGSDLDRGVFDSYLADGLLDTVERMSIYMSAHDKALGVSQYLTSRERLGQLLGDDEGELTPSSRRALEEYRDKLSVINVSEAEGAESGNGHGYFRSSPWVSSDVLMTLYYGLEPDSRGLKQQKNLPIYEFPDNYIQRLWEAIKLVDPEFSDRYEAYSKK